MHSFVCAFFVRIFFRPCIFSFVYFSVRAFFRSYIISSVHIFVYAVFLPRRFPSVPFFVYAVFRTCIFRLCHFSKMDSFLRTFFRPRSSMFMNLIIYVLGVYAPSYESCRLYAVSRASRPSATPIPPATVLLWPVSSVAAGDWPGRLESRLMAWCTVN